MLSVVALYYVATLEVLMTTTKTGRQLMIEFLAEIDESRKEVVAVHRINGSTQWKKQEVVSWEV